jgi:uncharacterized protein YyaL (SSP411 family)
METSYVIFDVLPNEYFFDVLSNFFIFLTHCKWIVPNFENVEIDAATLSPKTIHHFYCFLMRKFFKKVPKDFIMRYKLPDKKHFTCLMKKCISDFL